MMVKVRIKIRRARVQVVLEAQALIQAHREMIQTRMIIWKAWTIATSNTYFSNPTRLPVLIQLPDSYLINLLTGLDKRVITEIEH